jgi:hypothetical protein
MVAGVFAVALAVVLAARRRGVAGSVSGVVMGGAFPGVVVRDRWWVHRLSRQVG